MPLFGGCHLAVLSELSFKKLHFELVIKIHQKQHNLIHSSYNNYQVTVSVTYMHKCHLHSFCEVYSDARHNSINWILTHRHNSIVCVLTVVKCHCLEWPQATPNGVILLLSEFNGLNYDGRQNTPHKTSTDGIYAYMWQTPPLDNYCNLGVLTCAVFGVFWSPAHATF